MYLSINPLLPEISFLVIENGVIVHQGTLEKNLNTASTFPHHIVDIIDTYPITEIWSITGPGPFTLMRIVTLSVNAVALTGKIQLKWIHFFELIGDGYTPILEANPKECIIRKNGIDTLVARELIEDGNYMGILQTKDFIEGKTFVQYSEDISHIISVFSEASYTSRIAPLYFKAPHITTWSSKNTSHSTDNEKKS